MDFSSSTKDSRHSFTSDIQIYLASNQTATDSRHYLVKTFSQENKMLTLRCAPDNLVRITNELGEVSGGKLLPVFQTRNDDENIVVIYILPDKKPVRTLYERLQDSGPLAVKSALEYILQVCEALRALHKKQFPKFFLGFLSPDSILLCDDNDIKLINYEMSVTADIFESYGYDNSQLIFVDTRLLDEKRDADHLSDIFSVGRLLEYMLAAPMPTANKESDNKAFNNEIFSNKKNIPKNVRKIIDKCTSNRCSLRYQSIDNLMKDLTMALATCTRAEPKSKKYTFKKKYAVIAIAATVVILLTAGGIQAVYRGIERGGLLAEAKRLRDDGYLALSEHRFQEYINTNTQDAEGYIEYARLLIENGILGRAEIELAYSNEINMNAGQKSKQNLLMGKIMEDEGDFYGALYHYRGAYEYDKNDIANSTALLAANMKITQRTEALDEEFSNISNRLSKRDVISFIDGCSAYKDRDYAAAYTSFAESSGSGIGCIAYESYIQMMKLTERLYDEPSQILSAQKDILETAQAAGCEIPLLLYLEEKYALALYNYANESGPFTPAQRANMMKEAKSLFAGLYERGAINPNVYIYYAQILRDERGYDIACAVLKTAKEVVGDDFLVLYNQVYAEYDYHTHFGNDYSRVENLYNYIVQLYGGHLDYKKELLELETLIKTRKL